MPVQDIDFHASRMNKLEIVNINGERKLLRDNIVVTALPFNEVIAPFLRFVTICKQSKVNNKQPGHYSSHRTQHILLRHSNPPQKWWKGIN